MAATSKLGLYVPDSTTPVTPIAGVFGATQGSVDEYLNRKGRTFTNAFQRDTELPVPQRGDFCQIGTGETFEFQVYDGSAWRTIWLGSSVNWTNILEDTGWITTGLTITPASGWTVVDYQLRRSGSRVHGQVNASRSTAITFNANGDLSGGSDGDIPAFVLPTGWQNGQPFGSYLQVVRTGNLNMTAFSALNGTVSVTHGPVSRTLPADTVVHFFIDHDVN